MELHFKYLEAVQQADKRIEGEKHVSISSFIPFSHPSLLPSQSVSEAFGFDDEFTLCIRVSWISLLTTNKSHQ